MEDSNVFSNVIFKILLTLATLTLILALLSIVLSTISSIDSRITDDWMGSTTTEEITTEAADNESLTIPSVEFEPAVTVSKNIEIFVIGLITNAVLAGIYLKKIALKNKPEPLGTTISPLEERFKISDINKKEWKDLNFLLKDIERGGTGEDALSYNPTFLLMLAALDADVSDFKEIPKYIRKHKMCLKYFMAANYQVLDEMIKLKNEKS